MGHGRPAQEVGTSVVWSDPAFLRLVWTNEEGDGGETVTTVTFDEIAGKTLLVVHDLYPSKEALPSGSTGALPETLDQLDELLVSLESSSVTN